jgi:hypothetical protein
MGVDRGLAVDEIGDPLAVLERQRIGEDHAPNPLSRHLGGLGHDHPAGTGADHDRLVDVFIEQEVGNLVGMGLGGDAGPQLVAALGAALERGRIDHVAGLAQDLGGGLPDPAALIGAVYQYDGGHGSISSR